MPAWTGAESGRGAITGGSGNGNALCTALHALLVAVIGRPPAGRATRRRLKIFTLGSRRTCP